MSGWLKARRDQAAEWLQTGMSPRRLALTLALGFAIGCLPVMGTPTALCIVVAIALKLNVPAIQVANYRAVPAQLALMLPFVKLGRWMFAAGQEQSIEKTLMHGFSRRPCRASGSVAGQAIGSVAGIWPDRWSY